LRTRRNQDQNAEEQDLKSEEDQVPDADLSAGELEDRAAMERARLRTEQEYRDARGGIPKERLSDLRPYPLNRSFRSQPVLSEDLREELYHLVVERSMDVATVAATFSVDIRRVVAVVRLKTVEKQWVAEVSVPDGDASALSPFLMMTPIQKSISLEDNHMVTKFALRASLIAYITANRMDTSPTYYATLTLDLTGQATC